MSVHNVEVYRCRACGVNVVTSPEGFTLNEAEVARYADDHRMDCTALLLEKVQEDA